MSLRELVVHPVTAVRWNDFARLFEARGSPHYCWCTPYRFRDSQELTKEEKRDRMLELVRSGTPVGLLAYDGDEPVGWCSVAPRETYARLERSRSMPRVDDEETWSVLCFFVRKEHRGKGVTLALLEAAVAYARSNGATFVEGYPWDTAGISSTHRGSSDVFRAAGFRGEGARWVSGPWGGRRRAE